MAERLRFAPGRPRMTMATNDVKTEVKARTARQPATILIVEDEALVASYIQEVLEESGFVIAGVASSGTEAMERARIATPLGFLEKPFRPSQVFNALQRALNDLFSH